jgi:hypothetical protein
MISDAYTDIQWTFARLHNLHGRQLQRCPKAGDITLRSTMDVHGHRRLLINGMGSSGIYRSTDVRWRALTVPC